MIDAQEARSVNRQIAELLGWTQLEWAEDDIDALGMSIIPVNNWFGINPQGRKQYVPDYKHDLNAVVAALEGEPVKLVLIPSDGALIKHLLMNRYFTSQRVGHDSQPITNAAAHALLAYLQWKSKAQLP